MKAMFNNLSMESQQKIEILIEKMRFLMPSSGSWPVTMISLERDVLKAFHVESDLLCFQQLLFLIRTDFDIGDVIDYISNTVEFISIPNNQQHRYLSQHIKKITEGRHL